MKDKLQQLTAYELTNQVIEGTKKFMQALEAGSEVGKLEVIRDEVQEMVDLLKQKEVEGFQQMAVEKNTRA